jgi:hypothetical protein
MQTIDATMETIKIGDMIVVDDESRLVVGKGLLLWKTGVELALDDGSRHILEPGVSVTVTRFATDNIPQVLG